jgi:DNA-binding transcriptional LysR family regulator
VLRLGTSTGVGDHLNRLLEAIRQSDPRIEVKLTSAATEVRLDRVRGGQLDAAFVRGVASSAGLELIPVWQDPLMVAVPASHPLAAEPRSKYPRWPRCHMTPRPTTGDRAAS